MFDRLLGVDMKRFEVVFGETDDLHHAINCGSVKVDARDLKQAVEFASRVFDNGPCNIKIKAGDIKHAWAREHSSGWNPANREWKKFSVRANIVINYIVRE